MSVYGDILDNENNSNKKESNTIYTNLGEQISGDINVKNSPVNTIILNNKGTTVSNNNQETKDKYKNLENINNSNNNDLKNNWFYDTFYNGETNWLTNSRNLGKGITEWIEGLNEKKHEAEDIFHKGVDDGAEMAANGADIIKNNVKNSQGVKDLHSFLKNWDEGYNALNKEAGKFNEALGEMFGLLPPKSVREQQAENERKLLEEQQQLAQSIKNYKEQIATLNQENNDKDIELMKKFENRMKIEKVADIYTEFNPYRIDENEEPLVKGFPFIFMTTPFLNLNNIKNNGFLNYLAQENMDLLSSLSYFDGNSSPFIRLLSNRFKEVSMKDLTARTKEMYETFYGMKEMIPTSYIDSITGDDLSIKYAETKNLSIIKLHKAWVEYMEYLRRGLYVPNSRTIQGNYLDFTSSLYYFLLDFDMETILYFSKYTGLAPVSVPYGNLGGDITNRDVIDVDINYSYSFKEDLDPVILSEFNNVSIFPDFIMNDNNFINDGATGIIRENSDTSEEYIDLYEKPNGEGVLFKNVKVIMVDTSTYDESEFHIGSSYAQQKKFVLKLRFY